MNHYFYSKTVAEKDILHGRKIPTIEINNIEKPYTYMISDESIKATSQRIDSEFDQLALLRKNIKDYQLVGITDKIPNF